MSPDDVLPGSPRPDAADDPVQDVLERSRALLAHSEATASDASNQAIRSADIQVRSQELAERTQQMTVTSAGQAGVDRLQASVEGIVEDVLKQAEAGDSHQEIAQGVAGLQTEMTKHSAALATETSAVAKRSGLVARRSDELARRTWRARGDSKALATKTREFEKLSRELADATRQLAQAQASLAALNERLSELDAMKTHLLHSVSHELRTPLTTVLGYTDFLEESLADTLTPEQQMYFQQLKKGVLRLGAHVDELIDFSKMEGSNVALDLEEADFGALVSDVLVGLKPQLLAAGLHIEAALPAAPLPVHLDPRRVEQVLLNVLENAIKFSLEGGVIGVSAQVVGFLLHCEIQDAGVGVDPAEVPLMFQRFTQLEAGRRLGTGMGLGLSIAKKIVDAHHGTMGARSALGRGTTVWFSLPLGGPAGAAAL